MVELRVFFQDRARERGRAAAQPPLDVQLLWNLIFIVDEVALVVHVELVFAVLGGRFPGPQAQDRLADERLAGLEDGEAVEVLGLARGRVPVLDALDAGRNVPVLWLPEGEKKQRVARLLRLLEADALLSEHVLARVDAAEDVDLQHLVVDEDGAF